MITALGAIFLSYKVYIRQKSLENENHFFRYKMEQYHIIIQGAYNLHNEYHNAFLEIKEELNETFPDEESINNLADAVDDKTDEFRLILSKHSAFIPEALVMKLDDFYNHLFEQAEMLEGDKIKIEMINKILGHLEEYENDLEGIINLMLKDLGIEAIDRRLKNRTYK